MIVLHFNGDSYSDELDFVTWVDKAWWKQYKKNMVENEETIFPIDCWFRTNGSISFDSADDFIDSFDEHSADDDEIKFLQSISGGQDSIGISFEFPDID
tara:strand:+ start:187 stop:483 length:297 start_codon:yes stop_codon:yes gene_type:complete